jgi:AcrR family transcriptional regulator
MGGRGVSGRMGASRAQGESVRADARRNRGRVLEAAGEAFARSGAEFQMDEIAERAGVGVATVYRNFLSKDVLLAALAADRFADCIEAADRAITSDDAVTSFVGFFQEIAALLDADTGLRSMVAGLPTQHRPCQQPSMVARVDALHAKARSAGIVNDDVTADDLRALIGRTQRCDRSGDVSRARGRSAPPWRHDAWIHSTPRPVGNFIATGRRVGDGVLSVDW